VPLLHPAHASSRLRQPRVRGEHTGGRQPPQPVAVLDRALAAGGLWLASRRACIKIQKSYDTLISELASS